MFYIADILTIFADDEVKLHILSIHLSFDSLLCSDVDTVDNFVDGFERYMKGALTFIHMIFLAVEGMEAFSGI